MESPPPFPPTPTPVETHSYTLPPLPNSKIRLMCSYGGHIVPRPHNNKSLCYAGGETRIIAVDRRTTASSLSSLSLHLSRSLYGHRPFTLKYQLPNEELDSLISVTADEDLHNMMEEHDRISTSPTPSRIRLFLFPCKPESVGSVLLDPKSETWFSDALKSTMIINRGLSAEARLMGLDCIYNPDSSNGDSLNSSGGGRHGGGDSGSVPESMALETCSSFGSTSSSISMSNLPPIGAHGEDSGANLVVDNKSKVAPPVSVVESENCAASAISYQKTGVYQDRATSPGINVSSNTLESESIIYNPSSMIQMQKPVQLSGYQFPHIPEQKHQQEVEYVHTGPHYIQQYPTDPIPISSYYPMYVPYHPNQPYPFYLMPIGPTTPSYNMPVGPTTQANPTPELATEAYRMGPPATPFNTSLPSHHQNQQQAVGNTSTVNASYDDEYDNDLAYAQIYKSQPPAPKYETMTKAATVLLSDSSAKPH